MKIAEIMLLCVLLAGCATLSREQCQQGDWYGIGMDDGEAGERTSRLEQHARACAEYGAPVDSRQYLAGHAQGLREYCRLDNAFATGLEGRRYQHVCPPEIDAVFDHYNRSAYEIYLIKRELDTVENQITDTERRLRAKDLSDDSRRQLRYDLRELDRRYDRLRNDLYAGERYLDDLTDEARSRRTP